MQEILNNCLQIHQRERKGLETKLCPYLLQYLIYLLILNIHKVITLGFRKIYDGSSVVQDCIPDGFLYVRKRWLYLEVQAMAYSHCKSFLVYEETDGHIHVNLCNAIYNHPQYRCINEQKYHQNFHPEI